MKCAKYFVNPPFGEGLYIWKVNIWVKSNKEEIKEFIIKYPKWKS